MPTIACPGCGKQYNVPATAAGHVAKCGCGRRFRLGSAPKEAAATSSGGKTRQPVAAAKAPAPAKTATKPDDDFWDEALSVEMSAKVVETAKPQMPAVAPRPGTSVAAAMRTPTAPEKPKKKKKKSGGIRWGFDWAKVGGGLTTMVVAGGITLVLLESTGRLYFWPAGVAIVGLFTCLSGLMGEEGIW